MKKTIFLLIIPLFFLVSCSSMVDVGIYNQENANLNNRLDDVPLTLIVYQLRDVKKFQQAHDMDLATREDGVLGKDKIDSIRLQIAPKDHIIAISVDDEEVPYVGVLALFANSAKKKTKEWASTKDASGFIGTKKLEFEITKEGVKQK